tara:strand:+ start:3416 stop:3808 length:393 start_codon:yes stop_codon:yes gene_type:complete
MLKATMINLTLFLIPGIYLLSYFFINLDPYDYLSYTFTVPLIYLIFFYNIDKCIRKHYAFTLFFFFIPLFVKTILMAIDGYFMSGNNSLGFLGNILAIIFLSIYTISYYTPITAIYLIFKRYKNKKQIKK